MFFSTFESQADLEELLGQASHDGFIVVGGDATPEAVHPLVAAGTPVVLVDNEFPDHPTSAVVTANVEGSRSLTQHLLSLGHRKIGYVAGPLGHISLRQRVEGFRQAMAETASSFKSETESGSGIISGLSPSYLEIDPWIVAGADGDFGFETGVSGFRELWTERGLRPTAILCSNDMVALGVLHAALELGLSVPRDLSVAGFDDVVPSAHPQLTTVRVPCPEMGAQAARLLYEAITGTPLYDELLRDGTLRDAGPRDSAPRIAAPPVKVVLYPELQVRESTAPLASTGQAGERGEATLPRSAWVRM